MPRVVPTSASRRWGAGTAAIARLLIGATGPLTGVALARGAAVTQPRASQVLAHLAAHGAVRHTERGYVARRAALLDLYAARARPLLLGPETWWHAPGSPGDAAIAVVAAARRAGVAVALSADVAPECLVGRPRATVAVAYTRERLALDTPFTPVPGPAGATLALRWTSDATLLSPAAPWPASCEGLPLTDPVHQWWDLVDLGGDERAEAAAALRRAILDRSVPGGPG